MSHGFTRELHCLILLNLLVTFIHRIFFMDFNKLILIVVNLLPESYRILVGIDFFYIASFPAATPCNLEPVPPASAWQFLPGTKFSLVLWPGAQASYSPTPRRLDPCGT